MAWESMRIVFAISAVCAIVFLLCLPLRLWKLRVSNIKTASVWQGFLKAILGVFLSVVLLFYLARYLTSSVHYDTSFFASLLASLIAALGLSLLLLLEQGRALKSSDLAVLYLFASIICDVVLLTMPSELAAHSEILHPIFVRCFLHLALLILECRGKHLAFSVLRKPESPEELNGVLSRVFFTWINPILLQGYRNLLVDQDLPPLSEDIKPEVIRKAILQTWDQRAQPKRKRTLPLALLRCVKQPFLAAVIPRLFLIVFRYSQPNLIKESIRFVTISPASVESYAGYWLIVSAVVIYGGLAISTSVYKHRLNRLKLVIRSALVGLIHDKTMRSPSVAYDNGQSTTLMSTDADSLDDIGEMFHETWAQVIEVVVGIFLLARGIGWIWPLPLLLIYLCSHMSRFVAKQLHPRQKAWNSAIQSRVAATSSMLSSMKVVKMLGLEYYLTNRIQELREEELSVAARLRWVMVYYNASANALGIFSPAITLAIFAVISRAHGRSLDTETAFTTVAILSMVTHPANMVMTIVPRVVGSSAGFDRIQTFLLQPSLHDHRGRLPTTATSNNRSRYQADGQLTKSSTAILIQQLKIGENQPILENVNIEVSSGSMLIISGPVGSGKSTLLRAILGETVLANGSIKLSTREIAYCAQRPWLPSGNIKEVITHGITEQLDEKWYHEVIDMCCLIHDFNSLPDGDKTQIGSRGLNLSGGQRQRVALARAVFARCKIVLLDDTFSGLDGDTESKIFDNLFGHTGLFRRSNTTIVLISNSTQYFQAADQIVILGDHGVKEQGTWQAMKTKAVSIEKFTSNLQGMNDVVLSANYHKIRDQFQAKEEAELDLSRQTGDLSLYGYYFHFMALTNFLFVVGCTASCAFFFTIPQYWLKLWTEPSGRSQAFYICGFLLISIMGWASTSVGMWATLIRLAPYSGMELHRRLLYIVTSAPLSFFSKTDNGSILNRFSQDIQLIDKQLPPALSNTLTQIFKLIVQAILLIYAEKWLALSLPACMLVLYIVQLVYLRTSRQLRFLELESRAAVFSSFLESVEGLETIRSFGWSREVIQENISSVENSQRPEFLLLALQRWLNIVLDLLAAAVATGVVALAVLFQGRMSGGQVGIALNVMLVANTTLLKVVENWTTLEISLGAIARLRMLERTTPSEGGENENIEPPNDWPSEGRIDFRDVTASYHAGSVALRNLSFAINAGQKMIICGRTGSGKSTLLLTLLRILELKSGKIELDGVDISRVRLSLLRQRCFITVSQDTLLLSNETLRFNLDPDASLPDEILIDALVRTGLWSIFVDGAAIDNSVFCEHPILDKKVSEFQELSGGQCQLFELCRALIRVKTSRRNGVKSVILLDEATSSLDFATESTIHSIIDEEFTCNGHTVIIVAHRLGALAEHTKPGRDAVVLMGDGRLQEIITDLKPTTFKTLGETK